MTSKVLMKNKKNRLFTVLVVLFVFSCLYFSTRLINLTSIPVFGDEAIYIRWSQIIKSVETLRFIPLTDGKQPLFMWLVVPLFNLITDPLIAARTISILSGWGIMLGLFIVTPIFFNYSKESKNPLDFVLFAIKDNYLLGTISSLIYIFLPFSFFFDRMAVPDNLLSFFGIWSLIFTLLLSKFKRLDLTMILGVILGLAWLTKSPAVYFIFLSFITFIILNFKSTIYNLRSTVFPIISLIISFVIYNMLRLGPQFQMIATRNKDYLWSFSEILKHPFDPFLPHIFDVFHIYTSYISIPVLLVAVIGLALFIKNKYQILNTKYLILIFWWLLPLLANAAIAKVFTARYILFTLPPLIILISIGFYFIFINLKKYKYLFFIFIFLLNINLIYQFAFKPFNLKLPSTEQGYIQDWTSGWGIEETSTYLKERSYNANVIVGTEGYFGTLPDGLQIYTQNTKQLTVFGIGLGFSVIPEKLLDAKNHGDEVYILINQSRLQLNKPEIDKLTLVKEYSKPQNDKLLLFKL